MNITKERFDELTSLAMHLERRIDSLSKAGIKPGNSELLSARRLQQLLKDCADEFEAELNAMYDMEHGPSEPNPGEPGIGFDMCGASGKGENHE